MFRLPSLPSVNVPGLSSDPKLAFRNATNGLSKLSRTAIPADDTNYWKQYWELFDSVEEANTLITPQHIRSALQQYPENIHTLFNVLANHFIRLIRSSTFPRPVSSSFSIPQALSPWGTTTQGDVRAVLNCARVIARILPLIYEDDIDCQWLWNEGEEEPISISVVSESESEAQFVIEDDDDEEANQAVPKTPAAPESSNARAKKRIPSLMSRFLNALVDSLFHVGFTLPTDAAESATERTSYLIWTSGIGSSTSPTSTPTILTNRSTLLLTLLTALSHPLYTPPVSLRHHSMPDPAIALLSSLPRKAYLALLCSLLNTALTLPPARIIGQVGRDEDLYPQRTAQVLLVLLCQAQTQGQEGENERPNAYQKAITKLHRSQDFDYLIEGIKIALDAEAARRGLVNGVAKAVPVGRRASGPGALEVWLLLWRIVDLNKKFTPHLLASPHLSALLSHLFSTAQAHKDSPPHFALLRTLCYILQTLSSHRAFAVALSSPLPNSTATRGIDAFITAEYALMAGTHGQHTGLYQPLLISLTNVAPYVKSLSVQSSNKLVSLFQAFASPGFLLGDEGNPRCVFWMLEFFTHIIHNQFSDNPNLVYALLRAHERIQSLGMFTLASGRAEIARIKAAKEEHLRRTQSSASPDQKSTSTTTSTPEQTSSNALTEEEKERVRDREEMLANATTTDASSNDETKPPPMSEKARGKLPARSASVDSSAGLGAGLTVGAESTVLGYESTGNFLATEEWVQSWVKGLPLDSILVAITELLPKVQGVKNQTLSAATALLATQTLVGILPPAPPIVVRRFQWTERSEVWRASLLWGEVYVSSGPAQGPWGGTQVRLFGIKQAPLTRRDQAIASVTNAMGNMWNVVGAGVGVGRTSQTGGGSPRSSRDGGVTENSRGR